MNETLNIIRKLLFDISTFAVWLPLLVGLPGIKKAPVYIWVLMVHLFFAAIIQANGYYLWKNGQNNLFLLHQYAVEEFVLLTLFYSYLLKSMLPQRVFIGIFIAFFICAVLNVFFLQSLKEHNTNMRSLESLGIIIWTIMYFYHRLAEDDEGKPKQPGGLLLINAGFLVYFCVSLLLFSLGNFMSGKTYLEISKTLWSVHAFASILLNVLIAFGLWAHRKTTI